MLKQFLQPIGDIKTLRNIANLVALGVFGLVLSTGTISLLACSATRLLVPSRFQIKLEASVFTGAQSLLPLAIPFATVFGLATVVAMVVLAAINYAINEVMDSVDTSSSSFVFVLCSFGAAAIGFTFGTLAELGSTHVEVGSCVCVFAVGAYCVHDCYSGCAKIVNMRQA